MHAVQSKKSNGSVDVSLASFFFCVCMYVCGVRRRSFHSFFSVHCHLGCYVGSFLGLVRPGQNRKTNSSQTLYNVPSPHCARPMTSLHPFIFAATAFCVRGSLLLTHFTRSLALSVVVQVPTLCPIVIRLLSSGQCPPLSSLFIALACGILIRI